MCIDFILIDVIIKKCLDIPFLFAVAHTASVAVITVLTLDEQMQVSRPDIYTLLSPNC